MMIPDKIPCKHCFETGLVSYPIPNSDDWETYECPICEGFKTLPNPLLYSKNCPACGEPILPNEKWCIEHRAAHQL